MKNIGKPFDPVRAYFQSTFWQALLAVILAPVAIFVVGRLAFNNSLVAGALAIVIAIFVAVWNWRNLSFHYGVHRELRGGRTARITLEPVLLEADKVHTARRRNQRNGLPWHVGCIKYELRNVNSTAVRLSACSDFAAPPAENVPGGVRFEVEYLENTRVVTAITPLPAENEEQKAWLDQFRECFKQYFE